MFGEAVVTLGISRALWPTLLIALAATLLELAPTGDFDNVVLPVGTGLVAMLLSPFMPQLALVA